MKDETICKRLNLTPEQLNLLRDAAQETWSIIAEDCLFLMAEDGHESMTRSQVVAVVLDASHIEVNVLNEPCRINVKSLEDIGAVRGALICGASYRTLVAAIAPAFPNRYYGR